MTAREVDTAAAQMKLIQGQRRWRLLMSAAAAGLAAACFSASHAALGAALVAGSVAALALALLDTTRRRELIAELALNAHAYSVPAVKRYGESLVAPRGRLRIAAALDRVVRNAGAPGTVYLASRVEACRDDIKALATTLRAPGARPEPTSIALCWRLLTRGAESPLYNRRVPAEELRAALRRIHNGVRRAPVAHS